MYLLQYRIMENTETLPLPNANAKEIQEFWKKAEKEHGKKFLCTPSFKKLYPYGYPNKVLTMLNK